MLQITPATGSSAQAVDRVGSWGCAGLWEEGPGKAGRMDRVVTIER